VSGKALKDHDRVVKVLQTCDKVSQFTHTVTVTVLSSQGIKGHLTKCIARVHVTPRRTHYLKRFIYWAYNVSVVSGLVRRMHEMIYCFTAPATRPLKHWGQTGGLNVRRSARGCQSNSNNFTVG
jgi:hypothetical protein